MLSMHMPPALISVLRCLLFLLNRVMYDRAAQYWQLLRMVLVPVAAGLGKRQKHMWGLFWSAHQRFFR